MAFVEDHAEFLHLDEHAENCSITGFGTVSGIWLESYAEAAEMEGTSPAFLCAEEDVAAIGHGTAVVRTGTATNYEVRNVRPDGHGMVTLILELQ